jgi:8-oxo-dGTP diphosphatase
MAHIHTEPGQHDLTTTAFIIRTSASGPVGLLHMHRKLGKLLPVGGHVELNENPWAAVIHEIKEEAGYDITQLHVLQPKNRILKMDGVKTHPVPLFLQTHGYQDINHSHVYIGFLFVTSELPLSVPAEGESKELLWLTPQEVAGRKDEMPADIAQIYDFAFETALSSWEAVSPEAFDV